MAKKKADTSWKQTRLVDPKRKDSVAGMFETVDVPEQELQAVLDFLKAEAAANSSLEWVERLQRALEPAFGPKAKPSDSVISETGREVYQLAESILDPSFANQPLAVIVRRCYWMGRSHERLVLTASFDERVSRSRGHSKVQATKASGRISLDESQWIKVFDFIDKRPKGVSVAERCKQASDSLTTGTFRGIARVEIGHSAIRKNYDKRQS